MKAHTGPPTKALSRARGLLDATSLSGQPIDTEVSALRVGDLAIAGMPGEIFTSLGLEVRATSPFRHLLLAEQANDYVGYIPPQEAYEQGGYEVGLGYGNFADEAAGGSPRALGVLNAIIVALGGEPMDELPNPPAWDENDTPSADDSIPPAPIVDP